MRTYLRFNFSFIALFTPLPHPKIFLKIHIVRELGERRKKKVWVRERRVRRNEKKSKLIGTDVIKLL